MSELSKRSSAFLMILVCAALVDMILVYAMTDSLIMVAFAVGMVSPFLFAAYLYASLSWSYDQQQVAWEKRKHQQLLDKARLLIQATQAYASGDANVFSFCGNVMLDGAIPLYRFPFDAWSTKHQESYDVVVPGLKHKLMVEPGEMYVIVSKDDLWYGSDDSALSSVWGIVNGKIVLEGYSFVVVKVMS